MSRYRRLRGSLAWTDDRSDRASSSRPWAASTSSTEQGERLDGLGEGLFGLAQLPLHFLPVLLVPGLANRLLKQEAHEIEPPFGLAAPPAARGS